MSIKMGFLSLESDVRSIKFQLYVSLCILPASLLHSLIRLAKVDNALHSPYSCRVRSQKEYFVKLA